MTGLFAGGKSAENDISGAVLFSRGVIQCDRSLAKWRDAGGNPGPTSGFGFFFFLAWRDESARLAIFPMGFFFSHHFGYVLRWLPFDDRTPCAWG